MSQRGRVRRTTSSASSHNLLHHVPRHVRQPEVAAGVAVGQLLVVRPHQVKDGRVEIVDVDLLVGHLDTVPRRYPGRRNWASASCGCPSSGRS